MGGSIVPGPSPEDHDYLQLPALPLLLLQPRTLHCMQETELGRTVFPQPSQVKSPCKSLFWKQESTLLTPSPFHVEVGQGSTMFTEEDNVQLCLMESGMLSHVGYVLMAPAVSG